MSEYVAYYRVSTDKQGPSGLGLQAQREAVLRFTGQPPVSEYTEVESGRRHKNRPELIAAMAECRKFSRKLVIAKLERLSRDVEFISGLFKNKVDFVCADNPFANKLTVQILSVVAEHEREVMSERIKAALKVKSAQLALQGKKLGGPNAAETIVQARAAKRRATPPKEVLNFMFRMREEHKKSYGGIAQELNRLGVRTGRGSRWYASTVRLQLNTLARMSAKDIGKQQPTVPPKAEAAFVPEQPAQ
jgi:DNA invertase Pin-like site-specific DNA recombinase